MSNASGQCLNCGAALQPTAAFCGGCGTAQGPSAAAQWGQQRQAPQYTQPVYGTPTLGTPPAFIDPATMPPRTNGLAIAALVLSIVNLCGIGSLLAVIFGTKARREIRESGGAQTGDGMALAGTIIGAIGLVAIVVSLFALVAISFLGTAASSKFSTVGTPISSAS